MLQVDSDIFMQNPDDAGRRDLWPATVADIRKNVFVIRFNDRRLILPEGGEVLVYYNRGTGFVQQSARIEKVESEESQLTADITLVGEPVSAESRQSYRVSTVVSGLQVTFGPEEDCQLNDVSITGFSVTARARYDIGAHAPATLAFEGQSFSGIACVQSVRELGQERIRYGLHCVNEDEHGGFELQRGLRHIAAIIQRRQLRRLTGNA